MRKVAIVAVAILIIIMSGTYYFLSGKEYVVRLSESDLQNKLEEKLPLTKTYLFIVQVTLNNPRVHLENGSEKVRIGLDVVFNITIDKNPKSLGGTVDVYGGILYLPEKGQFFLTDPAIERLTVEGIAPKYIDKVNKALTKTLAKYYETHPVYTLSTSDIKQAAAKMVLKDVIIENQELVVILEI